MIEAFFAIIGAVFYASTDVLTRKGLREASYLSAVMVATIIGTIVFFSLNLILKLNNVNIFGLIFFIIAGIIYPGIFRLLFFKGVEKIGVTISVSINSINPLFSSIFAIVFLKEQPTIIVLTGIICVVCGAIFLERNLLKAQTNLD